MFGIHGGNAFNPFAHKAPLPVPNVLAPSAFIESSKMLVREVASGGSGNTNHFLLVTYAASDIRAWSITSTTINEVVVDNMTTCGAAEMRAGRLGVQITNVTRADQVSGSVVVAHLSDPMVLDFTNSNTITAASLNTLQAITDDDGRVKCYSAQQTANKPLNVYTHVSKMLSFSDHRAFVPHAAGSEQQEYNMGQAISGMSQILIRFKPGTSTQSYNCHIISQDFMRFPEGTLLSNTHRPPSQNHAGYAAAAAQAQAAGQNLQQLVQAGMA